MPWLTAVSFFVAQTERIDNPWVMNDTEEQDAILGIKNSTMKTLSFFSGCLGLDLGLEQSGAETLLYCENDPNAAETIGLNRPQTPVLEDILDHDAASVLEVSGAKNGAEIDLIVGGPPCQAFSTAGKRASFTDPRGNVFLHFIKIIADIKPKYFVIENVRGLLSAALEHRPHDQRGEGFPPLSENEQTGGALKLVVSILEEAGYEITFNLYNTANYGVPQKRERLIIIGSLRGKVPFLEPTHSSKSEWGLEKWVTFSDVAKDLVGKHHEHVEFSEKRLKFYRLLKAGQYWKDLPEEVKSEAMGASYFVGGGKTGFYRRISWDEPSPTLVTHPAMPATDLCHPEALRPLSVEEYKKIQQFPDEYEISGTTIQKYRQIGNAVPVGFGKVIGQTIRDHMEGRNFNSDYFRGFPFSRYKNTSDENWKFAKGNRRDQMSLGI